MSHVELSPVLEPPDLLDRVSQDRAAEQCRLVQVNCLLQRLDSGLEGTPDQKVHLNPLRSQSVVHDADVGPGILDQKLLKDQNLEVVFDAGRRENLTHAAAVNTEPTGIKGLINVCV